MRNTPESLNTLPCYECQAGRMHRTRKVYYTWIGEDLITVPDFPAWACDFCGRTDYDEEALNSLSLILSPLAGTGKKSKRSIKTGMVVNQKSSSLGRSEK